MPTTSAFQPPSFFTSFSRSQVASLLATTLDYGTLFLLVEVFHVWYVIATATGAFLGAVTNFLINRHWSFGASHGKWSRQATRYAVVSSGSLILNTGGVYAVTEHFHLYYSVSVVLVSILVGILFNYPLQRYYVYKR